MFLYDAGTVVELVATPDEHCHFVEWTGDVSTIANVTAASTNITMNDSYSITANFELDEGWYSLTISSTEGGSVTEPGEGTFVYGKLTRRSTLPLSLTNTTTLWNGLAMWVPSAIPRLPRPISP